MTIGIPLAMLKKPDGEHEIVLNFSGVRWTMYVDGELLDNDFPFGYPQWAERNTWKLDPEYVKYGGLFFPAIARTEAAWRQASPQRAHSILAPARTQHLGRRCRDVLPQGTLSRLLSV